MQTERVPAIVQDPRWAVPTRVRVLRAFCVQGARVEPGTETTVPYMTALDLAAVKKAEIVP